MSCLTKLSTNFINYKKLSLNEVLYLIFVVCACAKERVGVTVCIILP